jgi:hypothetical protein
VGAQPDGAPAVEDGCHTTDDNGRRTGGERTTVNERKETKVGGSKGRRCAGSYIVLDPILSAMDSYRVVGMPACSGE